jgi:hypothetical protein
LKTLRNQKFLRDFFLIEAGMSGWFVYDNIHSRDNVFFVFAGVFLLCLILTGLLSLRKKQEPKLSHKEMTSTWAWLIGGVLITLLVLFFFLGRGELLGNRSFRLFLLVSMAGTLAWLFGTLLGKGSPYIYFAGFLLLGGVLYRVGVFVPQVQATPFALGWSEGSRYYAASAYFSQEIYGMKIPLSVLDPSRGILQSFPFLLRLKDILLHRLWLVFLWIGLTSWMAWLFARRVMPKLEIKPIWLFLFFFLFFFQGAIYFHLIPVVLLVLLGYRSSRPTRTWAFLILASIWAGLSRINWIPVPGLLMTVLYLLDHPVRKTSLVRYLLKPLLWTLIGTAVGFLSKRVYIAYSAENSSYFDSALSSTLLWNRLFPNPTFRSGILLGIALLCLPLLVLLIKRWHEGLSRQLHLLRWGAFAAILISFLLGGIVVSTKIGGGGDLHNLDAYIVFFALTASSLLAGDYAPENAAQKAKPSSVPAFWLLAAVLMPVFFAFQSAPQWSLSSVKQAEQNLTDLNQALNLINEKEGSVLFISNRQLLTFHNVPEFGLLPDYEKDLIMEMAMSKNQGYLQKFRADLASGKINAVLVDQLNTEHQDESHSFGEENNAWVDEVLLPLLEYYQPAYTVDNGNVNLLVNKNAPDLIEALKTLQN